MTSSPSTASLVRQPGADVIGIANGPLRTSRAAAATVSDQPTVVVTTSMDAMVYDLMQSDDAPTHTYKHDKSLTLLTPVTPLRHASQLHQYAVCGVTKGDASGRYQLIVGDIKSTSITPSTNHTYNLTAQPIALHTSTQIAHPFVVDATNTITFVRPSESADSAHATYSYQHITQPNSPPLATQFISTNEELHAERHTTINVNLLLMLRLADEQQYVVDIYNIRKPSSSKHGSNAKFECNLLGTHSLPTSSITATTPPSIYFHASTRSLHCLWSTGLWQTLKFEQTLDHQRFGDLTKAPTLDRQMQLVCYQPDTPLAISVVSTSCVVIVGQSREDAGKVLVTLWESTYGSLQHHELIATSSAANGKPKSNGTATKAKPHGSSKLPQIITSSNRQYAIVSLPSHGVHKVDISAYVDSTVTLASVVGRMRDASRWIATEASAEQSADGKQSKSQHNGIKTTKAPTTLGELVPSNVQVTLPASSFQTHVKQLLKQHQAAAKANGKRKRADDDKPVDAKSGAVNGISNSKKAATLLTSQSTGSIIQRCIDMINQAADHSDKDAVQGYWQSIIQLLKTKAVSARSNPTLIPTALQHHQHGVLKNVLLHVVDTPETQMVDILVYALDAYYTEQRTATKLLTDGAPVHDRHAHNNIRPAELLIDVTLASSSSEAFLQQALRSLNIQQLHQLLDYLYSWFQSYWHYSQQQITTSRSAAQKFPTLNQLVDWTSLVLDAHFAALLIAIQPNTTAFLPTTAMSNLQPLPELIIALQHIITTQHLPNAQSIDELRGSLAHFRKIDVKRELGLLAPTKVVSEYQAEVLYL